MTRLLKRVVVFSLASYTIIAQLIMLREFMVLFFGNELTFGVIFAAWFLGVGMGAAAGRHMARDTRAGEEMVPLLATLLLLLPPLLVVGIRVLRAVLHAPAGSYLSFGLILLSAIFIVVPFSFVIGVLFPFLCLLRMADERPGIRNVGRIYVLESLGAMAGGVIAGLLLIGRFSSFHILLAWGAVIFAVLSLIVWESCRGRAVRVLSGILCAVFFTSLVGGGAARLDELTLKARWRQAYPSLPMLQSVDTRYQNLVLTRDESRYMIFGNGNYYFSFPDPFSHAVAAHSIMLQHPDPRRVLLIGGGGGEMVKALVSYGLERIDCVELDPALWSLVKTQVDPPGREGDERTPVTRYYGDGRRFVKLAKQRYDLVIINLPAPSTAMLNRYYTVEFYHEIRRILAPGGVLATSVEFPADYYGADAGMYAGTIFRTVRAVFPHVLVSPMEEHYFFATCVPGVVTADSEVLRERWHARGIDTPYFSAEHCMLWWLPERVMFTMNALREHAARAPLNTDFMPAAYYLNSVLWGYYAGSIIPGVLSAIRRVGVAWYCVVILLLLLCRIGYCAFSRCSRSRRRASHALWALGTTGFSAMALELVLLFAFQNMYGYVYQMLGVIVALFMTGLGIGGYSGNRLLRRHGVRWHFRLAGMEAVLSLYAVLVFVLLQWLAAKDGTVALWGFMPLVFGAGFLVGMEFPVGSKVYMEYSGELGVTAAAADSFDHFGACLGSLVTGIIALPLLGIQGTCVVIFLINAATGLLLMTSDLFKKRA